MRKKLIVVLLVLMSFLVIGAGISACDCGGAPVERHEHEYTETVTEPSCTAKGYTTFTCVCGKRYIGNYTDPLGHDYDGDVCTRCGYIRHDHVYEKTVIEPTCTEQGYTRGVCKICGATYTASFKDPLGHDYNDGKCTRCGSYDPVTHTHKYTQTVTEPDCVNQGYTAYTCECGHGYYGDFKDPLGHDYKDGKCTRCNAVQSTAGLKYKLSDDGNYYICLGIGTAVDTDIVVPSEYNGKPVKEISGGAFFGQSITSVVIQKGITYIGNGAFGNCTDLVSVSIPDGVKILADETFTDCKNLTTVSLPDGIEHIGFYAFYYCGGLEKITLPDSVKFIGERAFGYSGLQSLTIPDGVTAITESTFEGCSLKSIDLPDGVTSIGEAAFSGCIDLQTVRIPEGVTSIESYLFSYCSNLQSVTLPDGVKVIGSSAFSGCKSLQNVAIPKSVKSIENSAFSGCVSLQSVNIPEELTYMGIFAFNSCSSLKSVVLSASLTAIGAYAFQDCSGLESLTILGAVESIGAQAFYGCENLKKVDITDIGKWLETSFELAANPLSCGAELYLGGNLVTEVTVPDGIKKINTRAFTGCTSIRRIMIPDGVTEIGDFAFNLCGNLSEINFKGTVEQWNAVEKGLWWNNGTDNLVVHCTDGDSDNNFSVLNFTLSNDGNYYICNGVKRTISTVYNEIYIPPTFNGKPVKVIGERAFEDYAGVQFISIPDSVTRIEAYAFYGCGVENLIIPDSVTRIENYAFYGCEMTSITIPTSVTSLESYTFASCTKLKKVIFKGTIAQWKAIPHTDWLYLNRCTIECTDGVTNAVK